MKHDRQRPPIPHDMKRAVRKRCGYGCVFCGSPIYQIDHIVAWSIVKKHEVDNLTLLCGRHHDMKTHKHMISTDEIIKANSKPHAVLHPESLKEQWYFGNGNPVFKLAANTFKSEIKESDFFAPFIIQGNIPLSFSKEDGRVLLNFVAQDSQGRDVISIYQNEMLLLPKELDLEIVGSRIIFTDNQGGTILKLSIEVEIGQIEVSHMKVGYGEFNIEASDTQLLINDKSFMTYSGCTFVGQFGINIDTPGVNAAVNIYTRKT